MRPKIYIAMPDCVDTQTSLCLFFSYIATNMLRNNCAKFSLNCFINYGGLVM